VLPWVFRATVLTHWTSRSNPTAARLRRARSAGVSQYNKSCQAFIPFGRDCMFVRHGEVSMFHELQIWMIIVAARLISWLLKQNRGPTWYYMYPKMVYTFSTHLYFNSYVMINFPTYMIMLCGSTCIDTYLKIYAHVVAFVFLGKRWCQRRLACCGM